MLVVYLGGGPKKHKRGSGESKAGKGEKPARGALMSRSLLWAPGAPSCRGPSRNHLGTIPLWLEETRPLSTDLQVLLVFTLFLHQSKSCGA